MIPIILFLYDPVDMPSKPLNYHFGARDSGMRVFVASWRNIQIQMKSILLYNFSELGLIDRFLRKDEDLMSFGYVVHRTWGESDDLLEKIRSIGYPILVSYHPFWPSLCNKWNIEMCFRNYLPVRVARPVTFLVHGYWVEKGLRTLGNRIAIIFKPSDGARCEGINISTPANFRDVLTKVQKTGIPHIAQAVLENPYLFKKKRVDCRVYAFVLPAQGFQINLMKEGVIRIAVENYDSSVADFESTVLTSRSHKDRLGVMAKDLTISEFLATLPNQNSDTSELFWQNVEIILNDVFSREFFSCIRDKLYVNNSFLLVGVDLLLSRENNHIVPIFLEANNVPGIGHWSSSVNKRLQRNLASFFMSINNFSGELFLNDKSTQNVT